MSGVVPLVASAPVLSWILESVSFRRLEELLLAVVGGGAWNFLRYVVLLVLLDLVYVVNLYFR